LSPDTIDTQDFHRHLVRQLAGIHFEALGCPADSRIVIEQRPYLVQDVAQAVARHRDEDVVSAVQAAVQVRLQRQVIGEYDIGEVALVAARRRHRFQLYFVPAPETHRPAAASELQRERGAP
jgi:hypothetical protein